MGQGYAGLSGPLPLWAPPTKKTLETKRQAAPRWKEPGSQNDHGKLPTDEKHPHWALRERKTSEKSCNCIPISSSQGLVTVPDQE